MSARAMTGSAVVDSGALVRVQGMNVDYSQRRSVTRRGAHLRAVEDVSFDIRPAETLGLVGESGCGKTSTGRATIMLIRPSTGKVYLDGTDLTSLREGALQRARRDMQMVFQDPFSSLDPRMRVGTAIAEPLRIHGIAGRDEARELTEELLDAVGLSSQVMDRLPHEFSGGQRQRIAIARALAVRPKLIVCDEPLSALDASVQAQVLNLLGEVQDSYKVAYLFISHDLAAARHISHRVAVMYLGRVVEIGASADLFAEPLHPYTQALLAAVPRADPVAERERERIVLRGDLPSLSRQPSGCRFHTRCPYVRDACRDQEPPLVEGPSNHWVACHYWKELVPTSPLQG